MNEDHLIDAWLDFKQNNEGCSERTIAVYKSSLARLKKYLAAETKIALMAAPSEALARYAGHYLHSQGVKPISRRVAVSAIRGFYAWCHHRRLIEHNPAAGLPSPRCGKPLPQAMSLSDAQKLLMAPGISTFQGCRDTAILGVLIGSGCRVSGVVNLAEEDLIWTQAQGGLEKLTIRFTEKGKKERLVPIPFEIALLIRAYLGHADLDRIDRTLPSSRRVLFVSLQNRRVPGHEYHGEKRRLTTDAVHDLVRRYGVVCGIPKAHCHPHALRHLYGTELAESEIDVIVRQRLLGHVSPATTEVYTHLATRRLEAAVDRANPISKMVMTPCS